MRKNTQGKAIQKTAVSRYAAKKILAGYETFHRAWPKKSSLKLPNVYLDNLT
jgi:predicted transcriptional regulator